MRASVSERQSKLPRAWKHGVTPHNFSGSQHSQLGQLARLLVRRRFNVSAITLGQSRRGIWFEVGGVRLLLTGSYRNNEQSVTRHKSDEISMHSPFETLKPSA